MSIDIGVIVINLVSCTFIILKRSRTCLMYSYTYSCMCNTRDCCALHEDREELYMYTGPRLNSEQTIDSYRSMVYTCTCI